MRVPHATLTVDNEIAKGRKLDIVSTKLSQTRQTRESTAHKITPLN